MGSGWSVLAGVWDGLSVRDLQQPSFGERGTRPAFTVGVRNEGPRHSLGAMAMLGSSPAINGAAQEAHRQLLYLDGMYEVTKGLTLRAELMGGRDRDPLGGKSPVFATRTEVFGGHVQLSYKVSKSSQFTVRYQHYDPDLRDQVSIDKAISQIGLAYTHHFNGNLLVTVAWENPNEQGAEVKNNVLTIRSQFKL